MSPDAATVSLADDLGPAGLSILAADESDIIPATWVELDAYICSSAARRDDVC